MHCRTTLHLTIEPKKGHSQDTEGVDLHAKRLNTHARKG